MNCKIYQSMIFAKLSVLGLMFCFTQTTFAQFGDRSTHEFGKRYEPSFVGVLPPLIITDPKPDAIQSNLEEYWEQNGLHYPRIFWDKVAAGNVGVAEGIELSTVRQDGELESRKSYWVPIVSSVISKDEGLITMSQTIDVDILKRKLKLQRRGKTKLFLFRGFDFSKAQVGEKLDTIPGDAQFIIKESVKMAQGFVPVAEKIDLPKFPWSPSIRKWTIQGEEPFDAAFVE